MNTNIFRQVSLERLASPEELDHALRVTSPKTWVGLLAVLMLIVGAVTWGWRGSLATTAVGQGVIVRTGGVLNIDARGSGIVLRVDVRVGERIKANQVVARVAQPTLSERLKVMRAVLDETLHGNELAQRSRKQSTQFQLDAIDRQRTNTEREIKEIQAQSQLASEQIQVKDALLAKGLVTKAQTIAARQDLMRLQDQAATLEAQIKQLNAQKASIDADALKQDMEMQARISTMQREFVSVTQELTLAEQVVSPYAGEVLELKVYPGGTVTEGQPILSVQPDVHELELLAYLPSSQAKEVMRDMEVQVSPSSVKREEFGFMKGKIVHVSDYPATNSALMREFQNESLVAALQGSGPVTELQVELEHDAQTVSGLRWSTSKGPPIVISSGTICSVQVVTKRQRPISLLFPYVKEKLGVS